MPDLTQRAFDALLAWLDPDRELAGEKYEDIRYRLIKFFERRGCPAPEELADEVLNRVSKKLDEGTEVRAFEYFYGVALRVFHEHLEKPRTQPPREPLRAPVGADPEIERRAQCLEQCLARLPAHSRALLEQYYLGEKGERIRNRKDLARRLGLTPVAQRAQVHRLLEKLERCVRSCVKAHEGGVTDPGFRHYLYG